MLRLPKVTRNRHPGYRSISYTLLTVWNDLKMIKLAGCFNRWIERLLLIRSIGSIYVVVSCANKTNTCARSEQLDLLYGYSKQDDIVICSICIIIAHIKSGICLLVPSGHHFELIYTISNPPLLRPGTGSGAVPPPCANVMYLNFFLIFYILNHYGCIVK